MEVGRISAATDPAVDADCSVDGSISIVVVAIDVDVSVVVANGDFLLR